MSKYDRDYLEEAKKLPGLFKEIQDIRNGRAEALVREEDKEEIKFNRIYVVDHRFNAAGAITGILFLILFAMSINGNYIFAKTEDEKIAIGKFEENNKVSINHFCISRFNRLIFLLFFVESMKRASKY